MSFTGQPDVLDIVFDADTFDSLQVGSADKLYGLGESSFLFMGNILLGSPNEFTEYYRGLEIDLSGRTAFSLIPSFRSADHQGFPDLVTFWKGLKFIMDNGSNWTLICERDCAQYDFQKLSYGSRSAQKAITHLFRFLSGDGRSICPTFIMESKQNNRASVTDC